MHHALRPGYRSPKINTDSFGLRSPEVAVPKPAGTVRILLLGDSFTFGLRVGDNESSAGSSRKASSRVGSTSVEVVSAGVIS